MANFFANDERQHREKQIKNALEQPQLARVTAVKERHPEAEDRWEQGDGAKSDVVNDHLNRQFEVDLSAPHLATVDARTGTKTIGERLRDVPVLAGADGEARVPEPGRDLALVVFMEGHEKRTPVVIGFHYHKDNFPPVARRGTWRMQKGNMCFEAYEELDRPEQEDLPEYARMAVQSNDEQVEEPPVEVAIKEKEANSGEYVVRITGDNTPKFEIDFETGDIHLNSPNGEIIMEASSVKAGDPPEPVVNKAGRMNDTFLGFGGDVSSAGTTE